MNYGPLKNTPAQVHTRRHTHQGHNPISIRRGNIASRVMPTRPRPSTRWYDRTCRFVLSILLALLASVNPAQAAVTVDHDVMFVLDGVAPEPASPQYRILTYLSRPLSDAQKEFLTSAPGRMQIWQKYSLEPGGEPVNVYYTDPNLNTAPSSVTIWNQAVGGSGMSRPGPWVTVTRRSTFKYESAGRYGQESCMGTAPSDHSSVGTLQTMPGTVCIVTPPSNGPTCRFSQISSKDLGTVSVGEVGTLKWAESVACDRPATVTVGPVTFSGDDSDGLSATFGDSSCNNLASSYTFPAAVEGNNYCISLLGHYRSGGTKLAMGVMHVSYK